MMVSRPSHKHTIHEVTSMVTPRLSSVLVLSLSVLVLSLAGSCGHGGSVAMPDILPSQFGSFNFDELEDMHYDIEIANQPTSEREATSSESNRLTVMSKHGQRYSCSLPQLPDIHSEREGEMKELEDKKLPNVSSLLKSLQKGPCLTKTVGWWTYEYCHGDIVKQYHLEAGKIVGKTVILGYFQNETVWDESQLEKVKGILKSLKKQVIDGEPVAFHSSTYGDGTTCTLKGEPRVATAKLFCAVTGRDMILSVDEKETCNYTLAIQTPLLCSHPLFIPESHNKAHMISCSPLLSQEDYEDYLHQHEPKVEKKHKPVAENKPSQESEELGSTELYYRKRLIKSLTNLLEYTDGFNRDHSDQYDGESGKTSSTDVSEQGSNDGLTDGKEMENRLTEDQSERELGEEEEEDEFDLAYLETLLSKAVERTAVTLKKMLDLPPESEDLEPHYSVPRDISEQFGFARGADDSQSSDPQGGNSGATDTEHSGVGRGTEESNAFPDRSEDSLPTEDSDRGVEKEEIEDSDLEVEEEGSDLEVEEEDNDGELEEEALKVVEQVEGMLQDQLDQAGLDVQAKVKLEVIVHDEWDQEEAKNGKKTVVVKEGVMKQSLSRLLNELYYGNEPVSKKQMNLERNYNQVWSGQREQRKDKKSSR